MTNLDISKMLTLSTAHISEKTSKRLTKDPDDNNLGLCVYPTEYGWFIMINEQTVKDTEHLPKELANLIKFANDLGCKVLHLDCDGETVDYLETFDW